MLLRQLMAVLALILTGCIAATPSPKPVAAEARTPVTILVSIDGFRSDYLGRGASPHLDAMAAAGVRSEMRPSVPTKTFPNHYTMVTGRRPDRHGIVDNVMEDPERPGVRFTLRDPAQALDPFWWQEAEPIWLTAERQGIRTATMFWPGSEVAIGGARPADWLRYDINISNPQRIRTIVDWLRRPADIRPRFITLYFDSVDTAGHRFGPGSAEVTEAVREVDERIGELQAELRALGQPANFVIVADHGMAEISKDRVIRADHLMDPAIFRTVADGPFFTAEPQPGREEEVARILLAERPHMQCWRKADLPERFEYGSHRRVASFFCLAETGWMILARDPIEDRGAHGYDNEDPTMRAVFIASGPAFRSGVTLPVFDNVHVYPLVARVLGIEALPSDGDAEVLRPALRE